MMEAPDIRSQQASLDIAELRSQSERRIFRTMAVSMTVCAGGWLMWCMASGFMKAAAIPTIYIAIALACLFKLDDGPARRSCRRVLLLAGLLLPFAFQMALGGIGASGMVMLWSLPTLVVSVNLQSGVLRYAYLLLTGTLLSLFAAFDPALSPAWATLSIPGNYLLAFNLSTSMLANFILADRMLHTQRVLRRRVFAVRREEQERMVRALEERNQDMEQSLDYAARIQMALWPEAQQVRGLFSEMRVHYRPKEAVGGDLCWYARVEERSYFIVLDCTGHGVPGSLMSMLMHGLLNEVVHTGRNLGAAEVVRRTQQLLNDRLDRDRTGNTDGAEMAVLCFDHGRRQVSCSSIGCGIIVQEGPEMVHLKSHSGSASLLNGTRLSDLREHIIPIGPGTRIFMYTDGVADQFCANDRRKFTRARLESTLRAAGERDAQGQMAHFEAVFEDWRGNTPLVDDLLLVGLVPASCWYSVEAGLADEDAEERDAA
jgi:serine phosphatase RsbU (regulator of sigma subunit)